MLRRDFLALLGAHLAALSTSASAAIPARGSGPMPVLFIGHGSPMNAVRDNAFTRELRAWGARLPPPTAILAVSAHWLTPGSTTVSTAAQPATVHDFGGFPPELYRIRYPAPGASEAARRASALARNGTALQDAAQGLDHGTWSVLRHLYPKADVPVFQLSIDYARPAQFHYRIGQELAPLRGAGVLIVGSGNAVHNLRATMPGVPDAASAAAPWAQAFDEFVAAALAQRDDTALLNPQVREGAAMAVPTPDHYWPLLYALGASDAGTAPATTYSGFQSGTISMRCVQFG